MGFVETLEQSRLMLTEGAISERLRRRDDIQLHPTLFTTPLIYEPHGQECLKEIYGEYRQIAREAELPVLLCAPTWRVSQDRTVLAGFAPSLNPDAVRFMRSLQESWRAENSPVYIGGLLGPKNDCYLPGESLPAEEAEEYHGWQVTELAMAGVDVVVAQTFPAVSEALGVARACAKAEVDCLISFVINRQGEVLDSTPLADAVAAIDAATERWPVGYMVNCAYPSFVLPQNQPPELFRRLVGIQANASSLDHDQLDGSKVLRQDDLEEWGELMLSLCHDFGMKILGGCCGTDGRYLRYIARGLSGVHR